MQPDIKAPDTIWNNYDAARSKPDTFAEVRSQGINADVLKDWYNLPLQRQADIDLTLRKYQRHPETC